MKLAAKFIRGVCDTFRFKIKKDVALCFLIFVKQIFTNDADVTLNVTLRKICNNVEILRCFIFITC